MSWFDSIPRSPDALEFGFDVVVVVLAMAAGSWRGGGTRRDDFAYCILDRFHARQAGQSCKQQFHTGGLNIGFYVIVLALGPGRLTNCVQDDYSVGNP
jgi:hypothetical protein